MSADGAAASLEESAFVRVPSAEDRCLVRISNLTAGYGGGDVLHGLSFNVPRHSITCIVGPNGAGKSTLLAAISGILRPREGQIEFNGRSLVGLTPQEILKCGVAQVPQNRSLFPQMTVRKNVELGGFLLKDRALARQRLATIMSDFPAVASRADMKAVLLSGGQQRLVEFARCLMMNPTMVILDEPTLGLDPKTRGAVFESMRKMHSDGHTLLVVEQNARAALRMSSHGIVLENGTVRLSGNAQEVLNHPEIGALFLGGAVGRSNT